MRRKISSLSLLTIGIISQNALASLPEENMNAIEIITYYGYPVQVVTATTEDGYLLELHRIPYGRNETHANGKRPSVFLQHGLLGSSADWITNLPSQSLAFLLADAGFDVWLGNVRGNVYSTGHVNLSRTDKKYWQFTWDEISKYDLEAMISVVLRVSKQSDLYYIGHSQGTMIMFAKLAEDRKFSSKIRKFFALAPVGTVAHIKGLLKYIAKYVREYPILAKIFGEKDFLPSTWLSRLFAKVICGTHYINPLCDNVLFQIAGPGNQFNQSRLLVYLTHTPAGTSTQNIWHWSQMVGSGKVQKFDFGSEEQNKIHYGQPTPPLYNLTNVNVLTYLFWSDKDWLADMLDIQESLLTMIPKRYIKMNKQLNDFNHFDFIWGLRAADEIYKPIIQIISEHEAKRKIF